MVKAFRDTWELGVHSYLSYLRDRLLLVCELLHESGSWFVQISDENLHLVRNLMDEVFGAKNFIAAITLKKTSGATAKLIPVTADYIIWFGRSTEKTKYRQAAPRGAAGHREGLRGGWICCRPLLRRCLRGRESS